MKNKKLVIITIIIYFIAGMVFWLAFSPISFYQFIKIFPGVDNLKIFNTQQIKLINATSSEPVSGSAGSVLIKNNTWDVEIVADEQDRINGLSNRTLLKNNNGMLFVFETLSNQSFWMKDMFIPIDMIFIDDNWRIVLIESNVQPNSFPKTFGSNIKSKFVLEINALQAAIYDLQVGDQVIFVNK